MAARQPIQFGIAEAFRIRKLRAEIARLQKELSCLEEAAKEALRLNGGEMHFGVIGLRLVVRQQRRPHWKEEFVRRCGAEEAAKVLATTPPRVIERVEIF